MYAPPGAPGLDSGQLLRLLDLAARLNRTVEPARLLNFIIWTAADVLGCEAASILLYDAEADRLRFVAATGADAAALANILVPLDESIAGTIYGGGGPSAPRRPPRTSGTTTRWARRWPSTRAPCSACPCGSGRRPSACWRR